MEMNLNLLLPSSNSHCKKKIGESCILLQAEGDATFASILIMFNISDVHICKSSKSLVNFGHLEEYLLEKG